MTSSSTSESSRAPAAGLIEPMTFLPSPPRERLVQIDKLNLVFRLDIHRMMSWRSYFTGIFSDPVRTLMAQVDRLHVLRNLSLDIFAGDRVGLLGVNGIGKTSLCRCVSGTYVPTSGSVKVHGKLRAVFSTSIGILPELTGRENAHLLVRFLYPEADNHEELANEAIAFSELGSFIDAPYRIYSNGMQTRLCLSINSCKSCDVLILDEIFEGADAFFKDKISRRVIEMIEKCGAVIFVSHDPGQIERVCNRLVILHHGGVAYDGDVAEGLKVYQKLGSREVTC